MSKFIIGNKPISRVSGPVRVTVLKPDDDLRNRFKEEGARLPYIILFGDHHFGRELNCQMCDCNSNRQCCYEIDDPEFLKLFDDVSTKNYPIDFYIEQIYEPRINDPNIYELNKDFTTSDKVGYISKFLNEYNICYSKDEKEARTQRYIDECPTENIRWHYIDTRKFSHGNSGEAQLNKGIIVYYGIIKMFFNEPEETVQENTYNYFKQYENEVTMAVEIINNGLAFLQRYATIDSNFILSKQVRKQVLEEHRNMNFWHNIIKDTINLIFKNYFEISAEPFSGEDYLKVILFYVNTASLITTPGLSREEFLKRRKELIDSVQTYSLFEDSKANLNNMIFYTTKTAMMDIYTVARMLKKPEGTPGFLAMFYAGELHTENVKNILVNYFSYTIVGESDDARGYTRGDTRCQSVKDIDFNILKAKNEYK